MRTNAFCMNINSKLALLVYFMCNTSVYKEPVLRLNLKNKESVKIKYKDK